jgi:signal transduction histidine kinase
MGTFSGSGRGRAVAGFCGIGRETMAQTGETTRRLHLRSLLSSSARANGVGPRVAVRAFPLPPETRRLLPVLVPVVAAGATTVAAAMAFVAASEPSGGLLAGLLAFTVASTVSEAFPVPIEGVRIGRTSLASVFIVAAAVVYDWSVATLVAAATMVVVEVGRRRLPSRVTYNTALYALAGAAAGLTADAFAGDGLLRVVAAVLLGAAAFYVVDLSLLALVVARSTGERLLPLFGRYAYWTTLPCALMTSLTLILVVLWQRSPFVAIAFAGPLVGIALYQRRVQGALERLRELDRLKNEFIAVVSHELRTPLASVYGAAMTLQGRGLDRKRRESLLSVIYSESARLAHLVDQVLWASRLESGRVETTLERCDPAGLAVEVVDAARAHLSPGLSLDLRSGPDLPDVAADPEKAKQVLVNLIENAVKYSPEGGRIEVSLEHVDTHVRFAVRDEGLGIPGDEQQRIFEKFHRLDPHLTRGVGGSGLGLYISRELVEQMRGRIWVVSREGAGSTFSFELPLAATTH